ncbi:hypothetical protein NE237_027137 [Protea cynaroides]|uniref:Nucleotide-diphospho-sugar transferase domain-containing protein n=1 Tax=Protea cynaroides TaxID=273540 RepID=A0A9Q0GPX0_9MAGN|nr:hypothetical protein NE237_027137 [Protea cynaroides]
MNMSEKKFAIINLIIIIVTLYKKKALKILCTFYFSIRTGYSFYITGKLFRYNTKLHGQASDIDDQLQTVLKATSTRNRIVLIVVANKAYMEGNKTIYVRSHLLIVAMDQETFNHCNTLGLHCYRLAVKERVDFNGEKLFMSLEFIGMMMWRRTLFLGEVLKLGYSFIFMEFESFLFLSLQGMDIMWLRNPFINLDQHEDEDLQISCDQFNSDPYSEANINTGFYFIRSKNKTIALLDSWFLNTLYFSGFCEDSNDFQVVTTVHANCCCSIKAKVTDLITVLEDWKKFKESNNQTLTFRWSNHEACKKSWY